MSILLFIVILVALIVVHELGHFFAAKWAKMKVEEFGIGYPPRALTLAQKNGTDYTLNWLPFGGFVKIKGEDGETEEAGGRRQEAGAQDSFVGKPHWKQALVIAAGIIMNLLFAWVILSATLFLGMPRALTDAEALAANDVSLAVSGVLPGSPAEVAGLQAGDRILAASAGTDRFASVSSEAFTEFIAARPGETIALEVSRGGETLALAAIPETGTIESDPRRAALGVGVAPVGTLSIPLWRAPIEGALLTASLTQRIAVGLAAFFGSVFTLSADLAQISGPVGIAGAVGEASADGFVALLMLTAVISINLALINLLPVPALDGGRLLFIIIEWITGKRIPEGVAGTVNGIGFAFLILLMVAVTASDIWKLVA